MDDLRSHIEKAREASQSLEPTSSERADWQAGAARAIGAFVEGLPEARTFTPRSDATLADFEAAVADAAGVSELLETVARGVADTGLLTAGPGHLAFVPGGGLYLGALADHLGATLNPFSADAFSAPVAAHIHNQALRWLCDMVGYGAEAYGDLTSGGSHATLTAFLAARRATGVRSHDIASLVVYVGEHTHHCCTKALDVLFGGDIHICSVPSRRHAMDVEALAAQVAADRAAGLRPWLVVATAGSTNLGRIDPLAAISDLARAQGLWLHVDAAYGGFFSLLPELAASFAGLAMADSIVLDPHKGLFLPYGLGAVLLKQGVWLRQHATGSYLQDRAQALESEPSPMDYSLELTRPFRALRLWLAQRVYGSEVFGAALREKRLLALYCAQRLAELPTIELIAEPDLSILAFRMRDGGATGDQETNALLQRINAHPEAFLSSTRIDGRMVIRVAVLSFRTHLPTIERLLAVIEQEAATLLRARSFA
jgi:glutamate/tyrosine decarboxylase-like PLP-dependent enzyme